MRRLLWFLLVLGTLWCLWWFGASALLRSGVESWLAERRAEGWQAEASAIESGGFPTHLAAHLRAPRFADPATAVAVSMDALHLEAKAWRPGHARLELPETPIQLSAPDGRAALTMADGIVLLETALGSGRGLERLAWTSGAWGLAQPDGSLVSAEDLTLSMVQAAQIETYDLEINAQNLRIGTLPRTRLRIPDDWPATFDALQMQMTVTFDRPWDLRTLEERRPQPQNVTLHLAEAAWGTLRLNFAADLAVDENGTATGEISVQAENWQDMLTLAETSGALPPQIRDRIERAVATLARASGNPNTIDLKLTARNGQLWLGFLPLGPAPRLNLR